MTSQPPTARRPSGFTVYDSLHLIAGFTLYRVAWNVGLLGAVAKLLTTILPSLEIAYAVLIVMLIFFSAGLVGSYLWLGPRLKAIQSKWPRRAAILGVLLLYSFILAVTAPLAR